MCFFWKSTIFRDTLETAYIEVNPTLAIFASFLLGFGDACYNTQIYAIIGSSYSEDSASVFALFKFVQSGLVAIAFGYSTELELQWQLLILALFCIFGTISFVFVDFKERKSANKNTNVK